jgi:hypothetical protein
VLYTDQGRKSRPALHSGCNRAGTLPAGDEQVAGQRIVPGPCVRTCVGTSCTLIPSLSRIVMMGTLTQERKAASARPPAHDFGCRKVRLR